MGLRQNSEQGVFSSSKQLLLQKFATHFSSRPRKETRLQATRHSTTLGIEVKKQPHTGQLPYDMEQRMWI